MNKVQASIPSNTYVISGSSENKKLEEFLPGILSQLGPESMNYLRSYAESMGATKTNQGASSTILEEEDDDEDDVPDLVENFEEAAAK
jgi:nascent polypeptide-associated complex subunit beta